MATLIHNNKAIQTESADWQTKARGSNDAEYQIYLACANNGHGLDFTTGKPLKTYEEWLAS